MSNSGDNKVYKKISDILEYLGEDITRDGLKDTPRRVVNSFKDLYSGYNRKVDDEITLFRNEGGDEMITIKNIEFFSTCEHHMLPFWGEVHIAYIPHKNIIGLSKIPRIIDIFSRRLQNQERLTKEIAFALESFLKPLGVAIIIKGEHMCVKARGVKNQNSNMVTSYFSGVFEDKDKNFLTNFYRILKV